MKDTDQVVEKVLAGLRGVEAGAGFEERMVLRVWGAARERGGRGWFGIWQWVGVGCLGALLVGAGVTLRLRERRDFVATNVGVGRDVRGQAGTGGIGPVEEGVSQRKKPGHGLRGDGTAEAVSLRRTGSSGRSSSSRDASSSEFAGMESGFPAPPLPLTAQERLLLRAAQDGDARPAAVLEILMLPGQDAAETAEFVEFFGQDRQVEQSKPGESE